MLKNRKVAVLIAVCVILASTLYSTHRSLVKLRTGVEEQFYSGVDDSGKGVETDIQKRLEYSGNLIKIAGYYDDAFKSQADAVTEARQNLAATGDGDFSGKYKYNNELTTAVEELYAVMNGYDGLSEGDTRYLNKYYEDFRSQGDMLNHKAALFNQKARAFNAEVLGDFPANFLKYPAFVKEIEIFG